MPRRSRLALGGALASVAALGLVWLAAVHLAPLRWLDAATLRGFVALNGPATRPVAHVVAGLCDPEPFVWFTAVLVVLALLRRRPRTAVAVTVVLIGASLTTQLLKPALATPRASSMLPAVDQIVPASWPSGHATAAMAIALCAVLVAPARWRPHTAALGAAFAVAVTFSFLTLDWHYPSDVLGGFLVATAWTLFAVAAIWWSEQRWPRRAPSQPRRRPAVREALAPAGLASLSAALLGGVVLLARPAQVIDFAGEHTAFVAGAALLGAAALGLSAGLSLLLLRAPRS
jgi:membrane-associated phospholipid phosphatase